MTPEAAAYLLKARAALAEAAYLFAGETFAAAGRAAYYAGYHGALALIFEQTGKVVKTHGGANATVSCLAMRTTVFTAEDLRFLAQAYGLKNAADYATGSAAQVSASEAAMFELRATHLVDTVEALLAEGGDPICPDA